MLSGDEEYEEIASHLQFECSKRKDCSIATITELTMSTYKKRREWIMSDTPSASDILQKFPSLKHRKVVSLQYLIFLVMSRCLKRMVGSLCWIHGMAWRRWQKRTVAYSHLEKINRPKVNKLLESLDENANGEMNLIGNHRRAIYTQLIVLQSEPHPLVDMEVF